MDYFKILLSSLFSLAMLFISAKIIGNKQMSQLNMFDYINGITIGSIAADMAINLENNIMFPVIAITVYTLINVLISFVSAKNIKARNILNGKQITLMDKGKLFYNNFKTAKVDLDEFLTQSRINGYFRLEDIETAILEQNGMISFLPRSVAKPLTPQDMNIPIESQRPCYCVISDGEILDGSLKAARLPIERLHQSLRDRKLDVSDVFAALYDGTTISVFEKATEPPVE